MSDNNSEDVKAENLIQLAEYFSTKSEFEDGEAVHAIACFIELGGLIGAIAASSALLTALGAEDQPTETLLDRLSIAHQNLFTTAVAASIAAWIEKFPTHAEQWRRMNNAHNN